MKTHTKLSVKLVSHTDIQTESTSLLNPLCNIKLMSTDKKTSTPDERIAGAIKSLVGAVESKVKTEGKTPEFTFGQRVAEGVKKSWEKGDIASEEDIKKDFLKSGISENSFTSGALVSKATKLMTLALKLSKIDKLRADLRKDNKDITDDQLETKLSPLIESLDKSIAARVPKKTESTSQ